MIGIVAEGQIEIIVSKLAQFVVIELTIFSAKKFEFEFMDGSKVKVTI